MRFAPYTWLMKSIVIQFRYYLLRLAAICFTLCFTVFAPVQAQSKKESAAQALPAASSSARDLFSRYKDRLVQVRVLLKSANEQSSLGSGFVVRAEGSGDTWVLTNYHVISSLAIQPEKYSIELRSTNDRNVKATLAAVDVIHDLAVLHIVEPSNSSSPWPHFDLRVSAMAQGERIFSLGNPLELGFLISEGIYNGLVESRIYDQLLFSGALNSGMSGGPAIDESGQVVGVNVATQRNGESLSFLVPIRYAQELLKKAYVAKPLSEWRTEIARQLLQHQDFVSSKLLVPVAAEISKTAVVSNSVPQTSKVKSVDFVSNPKVGFSAQTLAGRKVATLDGSLTKCWAGGRDGEKLKYQRDTLDCSLRSDLYVKHRLYTGSIQIRHELLKNDTLAKSQFLAIDSRENRGSNHYSGGEKTATECSDEYVQVEKHVYRIAICVKAYKKFAGLYDFNINATQMDDDNERLTSTMSMKGFSFKNGQALSRVFMERLQ
jgi:serine protease Do